MVDESDKKEVERRARLKARSIIKRDTIACNIRAVHALGLRVATEPDIMDQFLIAVGDIDNLWTQFETEDNSVLDCLILLGASADYSNNIQSEVRSLVIASKAIAKKYCPSEVSPDSQAPFNVHDLQSNRPASRLPEIPLPHFDGDFHYWPTFRDRFSALVNDRPGLSQIDKMYYLIGCLKGVASDAILI